MRFRVSALQTLDRHMSVNLGRGKAGVSEQGLHAAQVRATIEHVRGKTVPKFVRAN